MASTSWSEVFFYLRVNLSNGTHLLSTSRHAGERGSRQPTTRGHSILLPEVTRYDTGGKIYCSQPASYNEFLPQSALSSSLVFTIVRHPLERLVSAYRDKFEFAKKFAYIYNHYAHQVLNTTAAGSRTSRRPSFSDFVNYLLRTPVDQYNDHWVPYWLHCHLCEVEYDVIAKMETITEDTDFISDRSGLSSFNISLPWSNKKRPREDVTSEYIKQLSLTQLRRLYEIYKPDFEMFDYSIEPYLRLFDPEQQP